MQETPETSSTNLNEHKSVPEASALEGANRRSHGLPVPALHHAQLSSQYQLSSMSSSHLERVQDFNGLVVNPKH